MNFVNVAIVICAVGVPGPAAAQFPQGSHESQRFATTTWVDDLNFLSANALLGGITAGIVSHLRHGSFSTGFTRGALGGAVAYGGKRTAAAGFAGAGFLGRQLGAVGGSITRNAALDIGLLDTLILPVGPLRIFVDPGSIS